MRRGERKRANRLKSRLLELFHGIGETCLGPNIGDYGSLLILGHPPRQRFLDRNLRRRRTDFLAALAKMPIYLSRKLVILRDGIEANHLAQFVHQDVEEVLRLMLRPD